MLRERKTSKSKVPTSKDSKSTDSKHVPVKAKDKPSNSYNALIIALIFIVVLAFIILYNSKQLQAPTEPHDLLLIINENGNIYTMDDKVPNCKAICVDETTGKFIYVSKNINQLWNKCLQIPHNSFRAINASKYMVLPGLIDTHAHLMMRAALLWDTIDISQAQSFKQMITLIKNKIKSSNIAKGDWVKVIGYDENKWTDWNEKRFPTRFDLDKHISEHKLVMYRIDLHAIMVNTLGLDSIKHKFPKNIDNISGGKVVKNDKGEITGLFIDNAKRFVTTHVHPYYNVDKDKYHQKKYVQMLSKAIQECNSYGLTGIHDMDEQKDIIEYVYKKLIDEMPKLFTLRTSVYVHGSSDSDDENFRSDLFGPNEYNKYWMYENRLSVSGVKLFLDGALGSRGAKLLDPYCDKPDEDGIWIYNNIDDYYTDIKKWYNAGWQLSTHAIGDKANRVALDMYEKLIEEYNIENIEGLRLRIEHAQIVEPIHDIQRFKKLSIIANMQPAHATSDLGFAEKRLLCRNKNKHNRMLGAYAWKSMLNNDVHLTFGSDFPAVGQVNPFLGIYAAVTRKTPEQYPEGDGWYGNEKLSMMETLKAYTINAAYASFQEEFIGSIKRNKLADFIFIDRDLFQFDGKGTDESESHPSNILGTNVVATFFGGRIVYHDERFPIEYMNTKLKK